MEIESEKKDKDINKTQNEREIERLNRKLKRSDGRICEVCKRKR